MSWFFSHFLGFHLTPPKLNITKPVLKQSNHTENKLDKDYKTHTIPNQNFPFNSKTCIKISQTNASLLLKCRPGLNRKQNGSLLQQNGCWLLTEDRSWKGQTFQKFHSAIFFRYPASRLHTHLNHTITVLAFFWVKYSKLHIHTKSRRRTLTFVKLNKV